MALRLGLQRALAGRRVATAAARSFSIGQHAADNFVMDFPQEHDGLNIEFNWSLAEDDVTPHGDAYRNLSWPKLQEHAKAHKAAGKAFAVQEVDVDVSFGEYSPVFEKVTDHLSFQDALFAHDGAVGSYRDDRTRVRVISDSPLVALFAQSLLVRVPAKDPHEARPIVVYVATAGEFQGQEPKALLYMDKNDDGALFAKVVITGAAGLESIKDAIALAKKKLLAQTESESIVLASDVVLAGDKSALVFNATAAARTQAVNAGQLYSAHLNIWNSVGLTSFFGGAIVDGAVVAKKQVVALENGAAVNVPCNNLVNHPVAAFFVDKAGKGVKEITSAEAAALVKKADADADADKFAALLAKAATKSFVVASDADINAALAKL
ncbi:hypothetical protein PybrP1_012050 [[Pythium] brassicae (nom. inval.)]|nr:hypothetical protein PybrP1_012050 [[Pythium] brassicae (nom. inval.)]